MRRNFYFNVTHQDKLGPPFFGVITVSSNETASSLITTLNEISSVFQSGALLVSKIMSCLTPRAMALKFIRARSASSPKSLAFSEMIKGRPKMLCGIGAAIPVKLAGCQTYPEAPSTMVSNFFSTGGLQIHTAPETRLGSILLIISTRSS